MGGGKKEELVAGLDDGLGGAPSFWDENGLPEDDGNGGGLPPPLLSSLLLFDAKGLELGVEGFEKGLPDFESVAAFSSFLAKGFGAEEVLGPKGFPEDVEVPKGIPEGVAELDEVPNGFLGVDSLEAGLESLLFVP